MALFLSFFFLYHGILSLRRGNERTSGGSPAKHTAREPNRRRARCGGSAMLARGAMQRWAYMPVSEKVGTGVEKKKCY
jgi:hypothetical protein